MASMSLSFVRLDRSLFEGEVAAVVLVTPDGELGVWPSHAPQIVALGDGVVRIKNLPGQGNAPEYDVIVSGGYAEITPDGVIVLADHARRADDIDADVVRETRDAALEALDGVEEGDHRRAYYENKVNWCNQLLKYSTEHAA